MAAKKKVVKTDLVRELVRRKNEQGHQAIPNPRPAIAREVKVLRDSLTTLKSGMKTVQSQIRVIEDVLNKLESTL